jgi:hypothetical protein
MNSRRPGGNRHGKSGGRHPGKGGYGKHPGKGGYGKHSGHGTGRYGRHPGKGGHGKYHGRSGYGKHQGHGTGRYGRHHPSRTRDGGYRGKHNVWHGRHNHNWNRCWWSGQNNCWLYGCGTGADACSYYWCEPDNCYYPVEYQPYNTCCFEESVPICTYTGSCPIYYGEEQTCWTNTSWSEPLRCNVYCVGKLQYYWCPPDDCYYPVEYKPYGVCTFEEEEEEAVAGSSCNCCNQGTCSCESKCQCGK